MQPGFIEMFNVVSLYNGKSAGAGGNIQSLNMVGLADMQNRHIIDRICLSRKKQHFLSETIRRKFHGVLEYWSIGVLEYWSAGVLEYWSIGILLG